MTAVLITLGLAGVVTSCGGDGLEGDWFPCKDTACTKLDDEGIRFSDSGRWGLLEAPSGEVGAGYELAGPRGRYAFNGDTLTLYMDGLAESESVKVSFEGEFLVIHVKASTVSCAEPAPGPGAPAPTCEETEIEEQLRFKRVGPSGDVPQWSDPPIFEEDLPPPPPTK